MVALLLFPVITTVNRLYLIRKEEMANLRELGVYEAIAESTPQFIAQATYMIRFGNIVWWQWMCVAFSYGSILRIVAIAIISFNASFAEKVVAWQIIGLGTGIKLFMWALIFASLRTYALVLLAINFGFTVDMARREDDTGPKILIISSNYFVQASFATEMGLQAALLQWYFMAIELTLSLLLPYYVDIFPGEGPKLYEWIDPIMLLAITLPCILVASLVIELLTFKTSIEKAFQ